MSNREAVDALLAMYEEYKVLHRKEAELVTQLAKAKITGEDSRQLGRDYLEAKHAVQTISDAMTFSNPIVWMLYKFEAYRDETQPIANAHDFRLHCSKPDYICTKRFTFLNQELAKRNQPTLLYRSAYPDNMSLQDVANSTAIIEMTNDSGITAAWDEHEYHHDESGTVAKWMNFSPAS